MKKVGRNEPCPCGSGKKYKHCCLQRQTAPQSPTEFAWRRIRREYEGLPARILRFVDEVYGAVALEEAWEEFVVWDDNAPRFDPELPHIPVFMPWFLHAWSPDPDDTAVTDRALYGVAPTQAYLERKGRNLAPILQAYLQSCLDQPFSFYEVERVDPGHGLALSDVLTGERHEVLEASASHALDPHDLTFALLASADGVTLIEATSPVALPADSKVEVIELRKHMAASSERHGARAGQIGREELREWEPELRELFLLLFDRALLGRLPTLLTPEGDALEFHKLVYAIDSPQRAFDAFKPHAIPGDDPGSIVTPVLERGTDGSVERAQFDLVRPGQDPDAESLSLLAHVEIEPHRLTVEVNSRERAEWITTHLIPAAVGVAIPRGMEEVRTAEQVLADGEYHAATAPPDPPDGPEVQEALAGALRDHYQKWIDTPLPALGHLTPRTVAQTADGREQVAAMLYSAEQIDAGVPAGTRKEIFDAVRGQLRLTE